MQPSQIVASRTAEDEALEYLVHWVGLSPCEDIWERAATLRATFPKLHLLLTGLDCVTKGEVSRGQVEVF
ncbi:uncharacterized protein DS421_7g210640 [Arachis hypogaea]|nr:uncharacterized protein DS421_7g210640 [Arachis hypogaea]